MDDHTRILAYVATCGDADELRQLMANAKRRPGSGQVADAAFRRLICLVPGEEPGTLAHDFWKTILAFEQVLTEERGRTTRLARTRQKLARVGVVETLRGFAEGPPTRGLQMLGVGAQGRELAPTSPGTKRRVRGTGVRPTAPRPVLLRGGGST